ncbi:MAG: carbon-nitrogen hydrolase family protein [Alphaproteobacteria bacterium]|nr:carbon-nitrogen hydrolase family protein [Alphaproteobacteria bacterium]MBU2085566.1 carbon-nitrogen hydrolase family protein [Alphaproteobacteria bacterium]MBU2141684.1 carbon-nitrogen hydrolase family protein [Alphaproteobacteria bacterium]MBU2197647.1 carbon-nitrogen hydrolase family protein [Alphaproteobacteria bacterium]
MTMIRAACVQMRSTTAVAENIAAASALVRQAAEAGAVFIATPEMTNLLDIRPGMARPKIVAQEDDATLVAFRALAVELGVWLLLGSIAVTAEGEDRLANRSFLIAPDGEIVAHYDKIHMFDVEVGDGQTYRESRSYRPGTSTALANTGIGRVGMTICYDLRFPALYRSLAQAGAQILTVPAAFTRVTGEAHWHVLLRARAIETGCFVVAPAQGGKHEDGRETYGHSLIISPWGEILAEADGDEPGVIWADLDLDEVDKARARIPSLDNNQIFNTGRS